LVLEVLSYNPQGIESGIERNPYFHLITSNLSNTNLLEEVIGENILGFRELHEKSEINHVQYAKTKHTFGNKWGFRIWFG
jgi:hypothetical protein